MNTILLRIGVCTALMLPLQWAHAQWATLPDTFLKTSTVIDSTYGTDQVLINGISYSNRYRNATGHPFFGTDNYALGSVTQRGVKTNKVELKYDLYNQELIANYRNQSFLRQVIIPNEHVASFTIGGKQFEQLSLNGETPSFYQVIAYGHKLKVLLHWYKQRSEVMNGVAPVNYKFAKEQRKSFLLLDGNVYPFAGNRSFVKLFPTEKQAEIKRALKKYHFKLRKCSDEHILQLLEFCQ